MKLFLFNNDEKLIGTVSPLEGIQNEEINKIQTIECTTVYSELIEKASYIGHKDYSDNRIFHLYKIDHVTKTSTTDVKIVGVHTFFDDMESDGYIKDFRPTNRELVGVMTTILDGSRWQLGSVNVQRNYTGNFYYVTRKEAISKLIEATQIEIKPRLEFSRGKITGRYLDVFTRLGGRNGKVFVHGRDLLTVSEKKSQGAIYTAVVGRGKGEETDTGGYGRRISFKDVEWRRTSGQPVDKPVGQEYVEIPVMTRLYGFEKGTKPRIKIVEFQDETDKEKLLRLSYEWLEKNSRMQVEYSAKVLNVGNLELGDTVGIFNPKLGIKYETRVFKVKRNLVDNKLTEFGIGDKVTTSPFSRTIELAKEMKNFQDDTVYWLDKIRERLSDKLINEDGYNYDLKADNEYKVPAGYYSFDKPIDQNPTKVVYMGAGKIAIANSKKPTGEWNWRTFLDGRGATLDLINTGVLKAGRIQSADGRSYWDLDTGEFHMEQSAINEAVKTVVNGKVQEIVGEVKKNLPTKEELKGKSSYIHKKYSDFADGRNMSDNSTLKYIGIYTGDKQQAPTNASEYLWTKIKGEDGERGRDGNNGRDGVSNYIHRKYSDYSNGANMSDNSSLKYIGIYTGTSPTPPTTASSYLWSKIKGEDGANGVPGTKGADGRTPYFHTAYSNSPTGDRDFSTTNSNGKEYIGTYSDFEVADSTDYRKYKWVKIKGEDGRDGQDGKSINRNYIVDSEKLQSKPHWGSNKWDERAEDNTIILTKKGGSDKTGFWFNLTDVVKNQFQNETLTWSLDIKASRNITLNKIGFETNGQKKVDISTNWTRISHTFVNRFSKYYTFTFYEPTTNFNNGDKIYIRLPKLETGNVATEWSPAYEDLQGHTLIANLRLDGTYINGVTKDVKAYIDVFYDGQKIDNGFDVKLKDKGGTRTDWSDFWNSNVDNGLISINQNWKNGTQNGQPLELIALVTYKDLNTIANVRLENIPDTTEIKEVVKKYKTFESTLEVFNSTIGEVKRQVIANGGKQNLILGSRILSDSDYNIFGKRWEPTDKQGVYTKIRQDTGEYAPFLYYGNSYLVVISQNNTRNVWQGVGFNLSKKKLFKGEQYSIRIPILILGGYTRDSDIRVEIKNHNTGKTIWGERLSDDYTLNNLWYGKEFNFTVNETVDLSDYAFWIYNVKNGGFCISIPFMCEGVELPNYHSPAPEDFYLQNSRIESSIIQTKNEIKSAVTENNFGTILTQNATSLRLAWNNISNYVQFENGGMSFYEGTVTRNKLRARIDDGNYTFWRDGYQVGSMGTGGVKDQPDKKGLSFFLDRDGTYMAWSYRDNNDDDNVYSFKWMYTRQGFKPYEADTLNAGCNVDFGWNEIKNLKIHSSSFHLKNGMSGTFNVKTDFGEETLIFENGLLVSGR